MNGRRTKRTSFSITYAPSADLDVTNVVVGSVKWFRRFEDWGVTYGRITTAPFFQVAKALEIRGVGFREGLKALR